MKFNNERSKKMSKSWFEVDKKGLAKILGRKNKSFLLYELFQNSWDQNIKEVRILFSFSKKEKGVFLTVKDDDPEGFQDLSHAFTLFAESTKKKDPKKRGRFNIGEKLVLAFCKYAKITTTTGEIKFNQNGERTKTNRKTEKGSIFSAFININEKECKKICKSINKLIVPKNIKTIFNGKLLPYQKPLLSFTASLPTEISDENGNLKKTVRKTKINIHKTENSEKGRIYEMGIPVVETNDKFNIDIQQKVPLNMDRDNVTPKYLRTLRTYVFNQTINLLTQKDINETWTKEALSDNKCEKETINKALDLKFGKKRVIFDPSDPEANKIAVSKGYTVIPGKSLSKKEWNNIKRAEAALPAGKVTPSPTVRTSANGVSPIEESKLTKKQKEVIKFTKDLARLLMGIDIHVNIISCRFINGSAMYGNRVLTYNLAYVGRKFFEDFPTDIEKVLNLIIHEFGHQYSSDHLSQKYYKALSSLGAKGIILALENPDFFPEYEIPSLSYS